MTPNPQHGKGARINDRSGCPENIHSECIGMVAKKNWNFFNCEQCQIFVSLMVKADIAFPTNPPDSKAIDKADRKESLKYSGARRVVKSLQRAFLPRRLRAIRQQFEISSHVADAYLPLGDQTLFLPGLSLPHELIEELQGVCGRELSGAEVSAITSSVRWFFLYEAMTTGRKAPRMSTRIKRLVKRVREVSPRILDVPVKIDKRVRARMVAETLFIMEVRPLWEAITGTRATAWFSEAPGSSPFTRFCQALLDHAQFLIK